MGHRVVWTMRNRIYFAPTGNRTPECPGRSLVTILTAPSRLVVEASGNPPPPSCQLIRFHGVIMEITTAAHHNPSVLSIVVRKKILKFIVCGAVCFDLYSSTNIIRAIK
jgi:hypothetical protein